MNCGRNIRLFISVILALFIGVMFYQAAKFYMVLSNPVNSDLIVKNLIQDHDNREILHRWAQNISPSLKINNTIWGVLVNGRISKEDSGIEIPVGYEFDPEIGTLSKSFITYDSLSSAVVLPSEIEKQINSFRIRTEILILVRDDHVHIYLNRSSIIVKIKEDAIPIQNHSQKRIGSPPVYGLLMK